MEEKEIVKHYKKGEELTIIWKPKMCIHSAICAKGLPKVFDPYRRPWVETEGATVEEIKAQIDQCPSGALSYRTSLEQDEEPEAVPHTSVRVNAGASLLLEGPMEITLPDGTKEIRDRKASFCRCGASNNKPFCDGAHRDISFD
ncbi:MAG: (4Fe-4S)-binding protein [Saprospiraceae bacterium]|nr:(4Fe-4S)-binding protein [Saprospiraceae bacterium]